MAPPPSDPPVKPGQSRDTQQSAARGSPKVVRYRVTDEAGQRLDNFLFAQFRSLPRSRVYRMVRSGEVRINGGRARFHTRLQAGDEVRLPPVRVPEAVPLPDKLPDGLAARLEAAVIERTPDLLVINKPAGLAVHGGSGLSWGLIEALRVLHGPKLELIHRLDRQTSGVLLIARKRSALKAWQVLFRPETRGTQKDYLALVDGVWPSRVGRVDEPLLRYETPNGERRVRIDPAGKASLTEFVALSEGADCTLLRATLKTGRTHQIRVHAAGRGHPVLGDDKYGGRESDARALNLRVPRLALHAQRLRVSQGDIQADFLAPVPDDLLGPFMQAGYEQAGE